MSVPVLFQAPETRMSQRQNASRDLNRIADATPRVARQLGVAFGGPAIAAAWARRAVERERTI
jgi:hypothetical protein